MKQGPIPEERRFFTKFNSGSRPVSVIDRKDPHNVMCACHTEEMAQLICEALTAYFGPSSNLHPSEFTTYILEQNQYE